MCSSGAESSESALRFSTCVQSSGEVLEQSLEASIASALRHCENLLCCSTCRRDKESCFEGAGSPVDAFVVASGTQKRASFAAASCAAPGFARAPRSALTRTVRPPCPVVAEKQPSCTAE